MVESGKREYKLESRAQSVESRETENIEKRQNREIQEKESGGWRVEETGCREYRAESFAADGYPLIEVVFQFLSCFHGFGDVFFEVV